MSPKIRTYFEVQENESNLPEQMAVQASRVEARLADVGPVFAIMSGKGGVGKSLLSAALAAALAQSGRRVGLIDADLNGPSATGLLGIAPRPLRETKDGMEPAVTSGGVRVMSMALLLESDTGLAWHDSADAGFVWRGAQERGALREFIADVAWGALDILLVDLPPGSQRLTELHGLVPSLAGAIAVTIPSSASRDAVARSLDIARKRDLPVRGLLENFSGARCDACGGITPLYEGDAGRELAEGFEIPLLARIPFDRSLAVAADAGAIETWLETAGGVQREIHELAKTLMETLADTSPDTPAETRSETLSGSAASPGVET